MAIKPKMYNDIVNYNKTDKWSFKASYGDKKKSKLWIQVFAKNETTEETIFTSILFLDSQFDKINWIEYNNKMLKKIDQVDEKLRELLISVAIEEANNYIK